MSHTNNKLIPASRLKAWLQLLRVSNTPTVLSNALSGCAIGAMGAAATDYPWQALCVVAPSLILIYVAGMAINDALDVETDRKERPHRPIPSGRVSRNAAFTFAILASLAALGLLASASLAACLAGAALVACAGLYNVVHGMHPASVVLMGGCRGLSLVTGAAAVGWPPRWEWLAPAAAFLWLYVIALSIVARGEARGVAGDRRRVRIVVSMVCAITLIDAVVLGLLGFWAQAGLAVGCFVLAILGQRKILGT
ncbi:MAG: UbiA family prenyltransferase [Pyrinomonadaceae bacterium]|nr:UbiA family prenyltransferase [Phycisphaerales bacterium]